MKRMFFLMLLAVAGCDNVTTPPPSATSAPPVVLTDELGQLLDKKLSMVAALLKEPVIVEAVRAAYRQNQSLSMAQIQALDKKWMQTTGVDEFIRGFMTNPAAQRLAEFQRTHAGFVEIFVSDARGLNVCQTGKTSDYYQADESWWLDAFAAGKGRSYHGPIEYDESAQARAISLYVPVVDPDGGAAIGVCKAVVDLESLGQEL